MESYECVCVRATGASQTVRSSPVKMPLLPFLFYVKWLTSVEKLFFFWNTLDDLKRLWNRVPEKKNTLKLTLLKGMRNALQQAWISNFNRNLEYPVIHVYAIVYMSWFLYGICWCSNIIKSVLQYRVFNSLNMNCDKPLNLSFEIHFYSCFSFDSTRHVFSQYFNVCSAPLLNTGH